MEKDFIRLECLKLANMKAVDTSTVIHIAKEYETFVRGEEKPVEVKKSDKAKQLF